jgi:hypothetical protein
MDIKRNLPKYIRKYCDTREGKNAAKMWKNSDVSRGLYDMVYAIHMSLVDFMIPRKTINKIMLKLLKHEQKRGRMSQHDYDRIMGMYGYQCWGCLDDQPNQLAHMEPGGCLYDENGFY